MLCCRVQIEGSGVSHVAKGIEETECRKNEGVIDLWMVANNDPNIVNLVTVCSLKRCKYVVFEWCCGNVEEVIFRQTTVVDVFFRRHQTNK